jgi:hypothetical protein
VNLSGFAVGQAIEMSCKFADSRFVLVKLSPKASDSPGGGDGSVDMQGSITAINPTAVTAAGVMCVLQAGEDLRGFAIGDLVEIQCEYSNTLGHYMLTALMSDNASLGYGDDGLTGWFDLNGVLASTRSDGLGIKVEGHSAFVNCAMPAGTDLSGFALGDTVEMECNYSDGRWNLASLTSDSAQLTLG